MKTNFWPQTTKKNEIKRIPKQVLISGNCISGLKEITMKDLQDSWNRNKNNRKKFFVEIVEFYEHDNHGLVVTFLTKIFKIEPLYHILQELSQNSEFLEKIGLSNVVWEAEELFLKHELTTIFQNNKLGVLIDVFPLMMNHRQYKPGLAMIGKGLTETEEEEEGKNFEDLHKLLEILHQFRTNYAKTSLEFKFMRNLTRIIKICLKTCSNFEESFNLFNDLDLWFRAEQEFCKKTSILKLKLKICQKSLNFFKVGTDNVTKTIKILRFFAQNQRLDVINSFINKIINKINRNEVGDITSWISFWDIISNQDFQIKHTISCTKIERLSTKILDIAETTTNGSGNFNIFKLFQYFCIEKNNIQSKRALWIVLNDENIKKAELIQIIDFLSERNDKSLLIHASNKILELVDDKFDLVISFSCLLLNNSLFDDAKSFLFKAISMIEPGNSERYLKILEICRNLKELHPISKEIYDKTSSDAEKTLSFDKKSDIWKRFNEINEQLKQESVQNTVKSLTSIGDSNLVVAIRLHDLKLFNQSSNFVKEWISDSRFLEVFKIDTKELFPPISNFLSTLHSNSTSLSNTKFLIHVLRFLIERNNFTQAKNCALKIIQNLTSNTSLIQADIFGNAAKVLYKCKFLRKYARMLARKWVFLMPPDHFKFCELGQLFKRIGMTSLAAQIVNMRKEVKNSKFWEDFEASFQFSSENLQNLRQIGESEDQFSKLEMLFARGMYNTVKNYAEFQISCFFSMNSQQILKLVQFLSEKFLKTGLFKEEIIHIDLLIAKHCEYNSNLRESLKNELSQPQILNASKLGLKRFSNLLFNFDFQDKISKILERNQKLESKRFVFIENLLEILQDFDHGKQKIVVDHLMKIIHFQNKLRSNNKLKFCKHLVNAFEILSNLKFVKESKRIGCLIYRILNSRFQKNFEIFENLPLTINIQDESVKNFLKSQFRVLKILQKLKKFDIIPSIIAKNIIQNENIFIQRSEPLPSSSTSNEIFGNFQNLLLELKNHFPKETEKIQKQIIFFENLILK